MGGASSRHGAVRGGSALVAAGDAGHGVGAGVVLVVQPLPVNAAWPGEGGGA